MSRLLLTLVSCLVLAGCTSREIPSCPYEGKPDFAPSAGCLTVVHGKMLVVESRRGRVSPPGGKSRSGESAQCAAHRETFEETGLDLLPGSLVHVFDTGFHLYVCEIHARSGLFNPDMLEVRRGYWLPVEDFDTVEWRFEGQGEQMAELLRAE